MNYSAALVMKRSCAQLNYEYRLWQKKLQKGSPTEVHKPFDVDFVPEPTTQQAEGNRWAIKMSRSPFIEMSRAYQNEYHQIFIYYAIDEIREFNKTLYFIEHKSTHQVEGKIQHWYFEYAILQVAFYYALHTFGRGPYRTAKFYQNNGNREYILDAVGNHKFVLDLGGTFYNIVLKDPKMILNFFLKKIICSRHFENSRWFDDQYKHKEWQLLKSAITFRKWNYPKGFNDVPRT